MKYTSHTKAYSHSTNLDHPKRQMGEYGLLVVEDALCDLSNSYLVGKFLGKFHTLGVLEPAKY